MEEGKETDRRMLRLMMRPLLLRLLSQQKREWRMDETCRRGLRSV
jgi:hypothetical protein